MDLGGAIALVLGGAIASIAPVLMSLRTPMTLTYHEFKSVCLSSV